MTITTTLEILNQYQTSLSSAETPLVALTILNTVGTELSSIQTPSIQLINTGLIGPRGEPGPQGPEYQGDDLPDFTLIFDNKLI